METAQVDVQRTYDALKSIARRRLTPSSGDTLRATALVNEVYLKLFEGDTLQARDRDHFFALASRAMRQILVDHFRRENAAKRGGTERPLELLDGDVPLDRRGDVVLAIHEALDLLAQQHARMARVVEMKFFGGLTQEQIATVLDVTDRTVREDWRRAKAFLAHALSTGGE